MLIEISSSLALSLEPIGLIGQAVEINAGNNVYNIYDLFKTSIFIQNFQLTN